MIKPIVPIFFACDENYVKFMMVTMRSVMDNASPEKDYRFYVLYTSISEEWQQKVRALVEPETDFSVEFVNVQPSLDDISGRLPLRDYYSLTTYYRLFIPTLFPEYEKVIYLDSDVVVRGDIFEFFSYDLEDRLVGAVPDQLVQQLDIFGEYVEQVLGVDRDRYFNAGVLLMNNAELRNTNFLDNFLDKLGSYTFVVAQDQDYLNVICKGRILWLPVAWNLEACSEFDLLPTEISLIHYNMTAKPWHYSDCVLGDVFWKYARRTSVYDEIREILENYTEEEALSDEDVGEQLLGICRGEILREDNYLRAVENKDKAADRLEVLQKIAQLEKEGKFDVDAENDPPTRPLQPGEVDYLRKKPSSKLKTRLSYRIARVFLNYLIEKGIFVVKEIRGIENFNNLDSGAILTCNHFSPMDSFAMQIAYEASNHGRRKLFRVIREGNYTSFPGFYGVLMRNCDTLPLGSSLQTMKDFMRAVDKILQQGHFVLIYPEQSLWWNYRKPKPLKRGGFDFAAKNNVPVLPIFITMEDTDRMGPDGFPIQAYTINVCPAIYPDPLKKPRENAFAMLEANYAAWKKVYEDFYKEELTYTCEGPVDALGAGVGEYDAQ